jgi:hypothetical protein
MLGNILYRILPIIPCDSILIFLSFGFEMSDSYPRKCHPTSLREVIVLRLYWAGIEHNVEPIDNADADILVFLGILIDVHRRKAQPLESQRMGVDISLWNVWI